MSIPWSDFVKLVQQHQSFLLTSHVRPDCDALGSELGMAGVLQALRKTVRIVNGDSTPPNLAFIDPEQRIEVLHRDVTPTDVQGMDVLMILDTSAWVQLGAMADVVRAFRGITIIVDHHVSADDFDATKFKDVGAEATGRLVVDAAKHLEVPLTPRIARPLFAAVATDTGWFRFGSATEATYRLAAELVAAGAAPAEIYAHLYERDSEARVRLRGVILSRVQTELDGRLVHTAVRKSDFDATGALPSDTEDVVNLTLAIAGTQVAVILVEQLSGGFKISFRSRCQVDCSELAARFGGGGHKAAAGAFVEADFDAAQRLVLDAVREAMK